MTRMPPPTPSNSSAYGPGSGYRTPGLPAPGYVDERLARSPYPPGREPIPSRRRVQRRTPIVAPLLAFVGLVLVAAASLWAITFLNATLDSGDGAAAALPDATPRDDPAVTASDDPVPATIDPDAADLTQPAMVVEPPPDQRADVTGTILFTRGGDIWAASGQTLVQLTDSDSTRSDSAPTWSPDGQHIYFIRTSKRETENSRPGGKYTLYPTDVMRMKADGSGRKRILKSLIQDSRGLWFSHVLQPAASPDDKTLAVVSDGPQGEGPVVLHVLNVKNGQLRKVAAPSQGDLGHNDPDFSSDGRKIAFTYNFAQGTSGMPRIAIHSCQTRANCSLGRTKPLRQGFANPSWSPDGSWLAVEKTSGDGRDIAIISARNGNVKVQLTRDGDSFAPTVSPSEDQIAYLKRDATDIDLRVMTIEIDERGTITLVDDRAVTQDGGIDGNSAPSWFIPPEQRSPSEPDVVAPDGLDTGDGLAAGEAASAGDAAGEAASDDAAGEVTSADDAAGQAGPSDEGAPPPP